MHIALSTPSLGLSVSPALTSDLLGGAQVYVQDDNNTPFLLTEEVLPGKHTVSFNPFLYSIHDNRAFPRGTYTQQLSPLTNGERVQTTQVATSIAD